MKALVGIIAVVSLLAASFTGYTFLRERAVAQDAEVFMQALQNSDIEGAYRRMVPHFQEAMTAEQFSQYVANQHLAGFDSIRWGDRTIEWGGYAHVPMHLQAGETMTFVELRMEQDEGGNWIVNGIRLAPATTP